MNIGGWLSKGRSRGTPEAGPAKIEQPQDGGAISLDALSCGVAACYGPDIPSRFTSAAEYIGLDPTAPLSFTAAGWVLTMTLPPNDALRSPASMILHGASIADDFTSEELTPQEVAHHPLIAPWAAPDLSTFFGLALQRAAPFCFAAPDAPVSEVVVLSNVDGELRVDVRQQYGTRNGTLAVDLRFGAVRPGPFPEPEANTGAFIMPAGQLRKLALSVRAFAQPDALRAAVTLARTLQQRSAQLAPATI